MNIRAYALSTVLGAFAYAPWAWAFIHSPSLPASTLLSFPNNRNNARQLHSQTGPVSSSPIISQLAYYPSDETLSERLKNVQAEWDNVKKDGIGKFFVDELEAAERILQGNAADAESKANDVIEKGSSAEEGGDYLLKEGFHKMSETGKMLAQEIWEVRQEFDELKAAKVVEEAAENVVSTDVLVEKDLEKVVENVVSSLQSAEKVIEAAIATVASKEGLTDSARVELTANLEKKAQNIEESIKVADSVAKTAKQIAVEDEKVMVELQKTGDRLSEAIEATESLTKTLKGTEGGAAIDAVSTTVDQTASIVREDLSAAESIADAVGQKVMMEADAVMAMDEKAADSVKSVRAAKATIGESSSDNSSEALKEALTKNADDIKIDSGTAEKLAKAIEQDAANDEEALDALESSSRGVNELIDAVDDAVGKASDVTSNDVGATSVTEAVKNIEEEVEGVEESMSEVEKAAEECEDYHVKEVAEEMEVMKEKSESKHFGRESESEPEIKSDSGSGKEEWKSESKGDDKPPKQDLEISSSDGEDDLIEIADAGKNEELLARSETSGGVDEPANSQPLEEPITIAKDDTSLDLEGDYGSECVGDAIASTVDSSHHTSDSLSDVTGMGMNSISGEDFADSLASADHSGGLDTMVASAANTASDVGESILSSSSDIMHDMTTSTTEALSETVAVVSSLFS